MLESVISTEINEYFGLNTKQSRAKLALGFSADLHDIDLSTPGVAKTRGGSDTLNDYTAPLGNGALELDGTDDYGSMPDHASFDVSGGVWTFNARIKVDSIAANRTIFSQITDANNYKVCRVLTTGAIEYRVVAAGVAVVTCASAAGVIAIDTAYHIEVVENGNAFYIFVNGTSVATATDADREANYTGAFEIGRLNVAGSEGYFDGHIDEVRLLNATAAHTANFTVPTTAYASTADTAFLFHFEDDDSQTSAPTDSSGTPKTMTLNGGAKLHVGAMGAAIMRISEYFNPSTDVHQIVGNFGTKVFKMELTGRWSVIGSGFTNGSIFDFLNYKTRLYMGNGEEECKISDSGGTVRKWGITKPASAPTLAVGAAGTPNGTYNYAVTFVNGTTGHESSRSVLAEIALANQRCDLSAIPVSADTQVTKRRLYRTTAGGAILFFLAEIGDNSTTTYTDNAADASLGTSVAPEYNDPPANFFAIEDFDGRIFGVEKNSTKVKFSNDEYLTPAGVGLPEESFGSDNEIDFKARVFGIKKSPNFNELWVHTSKGVYAVIPSGIPDDPYYVRVRNSAWWAISHYSIVNIYNDQWFIADNGKLISLDSDGDVNYESYYIEPTLTATNKTIHNKLQGVHYRNGSKNQYRMTVATSGESTPNRMLAANYLQRTPPDENGINYPVWELHRISTTAMGIVKDTNGDDILYTGGSDGKLKKQDTGTSDDGSAIDWSFSLGWLRTSTNAAKTHFPRKVEQYLNPLGSYSWSVRTDFDFGSKGGQVYSVGTEPFGDRLDTTFIFDQSRFAGDTPLEREVIDLAGDYVYAELTWYGAVVDQVMEMHNVVILSVPIDGGYRDR